MTTNTDRTILVGETTAGHGAGDVSPGEPVQLPVEEILTGRAFATGKSGSGKSNTGGVVCEQLLDRGHSLLVVDIEGEYYSLKENYEVLHVGADEEVDLRVGPEHAEKIASLALEQHVPVVLDVSGYLDEDVRDELVYQVVRHLFAKEKTVRRPFLLLVEEIHEFVPERGNAGDVGQMMIRVAKRGRKRGLGVLGASQRPANVKKDFITQCDWLVWHRLTWSNDTAVVRDVLSADHADAVEELQPGESFLQADFLDPEVRRMQWRRKETFDAGATPGLDDVKRPELKSISEDLVDELEEISAARERRQDELARKENRIEELETELAELQEELESARDMRNLAQQMAEGLQAGGGDGDVASEKVDELIDERNKLRSEVQERDDRIEELEQQVSNLQHELEQRPEIGERTVEAVEVLAEEFDVADGDNEALRRKLKNAREKIDELEKRQVSAADLESDPLDNRKVQSVVRDIESRLSGLGEKERQMLRYFVVSGPASQSEAYKYAGGSPTSGAKSTKTKTLRNAGLVKKVGRGEYDFGLQEHLRDVLNGFSENELDRVYDHLESEVYDFVMEGNNNA